MRCAPGLFISSPGSRILINLYQYQNRYLIFALLRGYYDYFLIQALVHESQGVVNILLVNRGVRFVWWTLYLITVGVSNSVLLLISSFVWTIKIYITRSSHYFALFDEYSLMHTITV